MQKAQKKKKKEKKEKRIWHFCAVFLVRWLCPDPTQSWVAALQRCAAQSSRPHLSEALVRCSSAVHWPQHHSSSISERARIHPETSSLWSLSGKYCYWLISFTFLPPITPWAVTRMNKAVSQSRIWSLSVSCGLYEWTGLLFVSYWELISCLLGLLLSLWNNRCLQPLTM